MESEVDCIRGGSMQIGADNEPNNVYFGDDGFHSRRCSPRNQFQQSVCQLVDQGEPMGPLKSPNAHPLEVRQVLGAAYIHIDKRLHVGYILLKGFAFAEETSNSLEVMIDYCLRRRMLAGIVATPLSMLWRR